jgi:tRNA pseudouridine55 synthase
MDGVLVIDKPAGMTSHDVVDQVRRILRVRRVGHTGTLDPFATGVLVMMLGRATRLAQFLSGVEKEYEAVIRLGYATDTGDITGRPIPETQIEPGPARLLSDGKEEIETALAALRGEIDQVPPMYSAKKQAGRKLYELARRGEEVERKPVRVCIYELEAINLASKPTAELLKDNGDGTFDFEVRVVCSAGTYIRTLAEDFGKRLGMGAHLAELRRTRAGDFNIQHASTLEQLKVNYAEESLGRIIRAPDEALARLPFVDLSADDLRRVRNGMSINVSHADWSDGEQVRLRDEAGQLVAVGKFNAADTSLHPGVVIAPDETQKS